MRSLVLTLVLVSIGTPAMATTCEESFRKKGDFFNGAAYTAQIQIEGMSVEKAFSQLRPILARESIQTLSTDLELGIMKAENPATPFQRALPIDIFASTDNNLLTVEMVFTLPGGVGASKSTVQKHLCNALNQLLPKGTTTAAGATAVQAAPIEVEAIALGQQVNEAADNPARLRVNFIGKTFKVSGNVLSIADRGGSYTVSFAGASPTTDGTTPAPMTIACAMAPNQDIIVAALETNKPTTLLGRFQGFDSATQTIKLQECSGL